MPPGKRPTPPKDIFGANKPKPVSPAPINSSYMDPKWQNPTAKFDTAAKNIVQAPSDDPLNWRAIADQQLGLSKNLGAGGAGGASPAPVGSNAALGFPDPRNDLNPLYDAARDRMGKLNTELGGEYEKAIAAIKANYTKGDADVYGQYQNSRTALDAEAAAMGVDPNQIYKGYDQDLRRVEENSNTQQNADLAFFEKMKTLRGQQFTDMQASLEQQRAKALSDQNLQWIEAIAAMQANAAGGSSGGGGGRGGGGGSSSSSGAVTETAKMDEKLYSVGDIEQYNALIASGDEEGAAAYLSYLQQSTGSPASKFAAKQLADLKSTPVEKVVPKTTSAQNTWIKGVLNNVYKAKANTTNAAAEAERKRKIAAAQTAVNAFLKNSGIMGNPAVTTNVNSSSKRKT